MRKETCLNCKFFYSTKLEEAQTYKKGQCRIGAPHPLHGFPEFIWYQEEGKQYWCGEWEKKGEEDEGN